VLNFRFSKHKDIYISSKAICFGLFIFLFFSSCKITQELNKGELLVNKVEIDGIENNKLEDGAKLLIKQKPNKRLFGFWRFYLRAYNYGMRGDTSKWHRRFARKNVGEEPVILDTNKLNQSTKQIEAYLFNNGFFNRNVSYEVIPKKGNSKKATVKYTVIQNTRYKIKNVTYGVDERDLYFLIIKDTINSKLKSGDFFSAENMSEERTRITARLRNLGYYYFNKEYIVYAVDSTISGNKVNIDLQIRNPDYFETHKRYRIKNIYVNIINPIITDTTSKAVNWHNNENLWINTNGYRINEDLILKRILINTGSLFNQDEVDRTYYLLNDLQLFRQTGISFANDSTDGNLNCFINLFPAKKQEIIIEPQLITSDQNNAVEQNNQRNYGLANTLAYRNKNLLGRAESFELRYRISLEGQLRNNDSLPFLNNIEHNVTGTLGFPRLTLLNPTKNWFTPRNVSSALEANFIYESNIDFNRRVLALGYKESFFTKNLLHNFSVSFVEVSFNKTDAKRNFLALVNPADSIFIANLFTTNLISSTRVTWFYTDKRLSKNGTFFSSKISLESAGIGLNAFMQTTNQPLPADGVYKIDNVNFEQFIKFDGDVRYTHVLNDRNTLAYRFHLGVGKAYGNSEIMPFVRRYFIGGANSLRGWRPRTLGPGSFTNTVSGLRADRSGEMIIEAQAEYRFSIIKNLLEGAVFGDAGNIWYTKPLEGREGVDFKTRTFLNEMAVSSGFGIRFDFSFFVLRFDFGLPIRNPELLDNDRWLFDEYRTGEKKLFNSVILNLGLGYPF
jgi:outer membrane protein assembly factor BamA